MPFRYLRDPLFLFSLILYFTNRFVLKPLLSGGFFHEHLNDLICVPFWLPIMLWGMRRTGLRSDDAPPRWYEIIIPLLTWSVMFELVLPWAGPYQRFATSDPADILFYTLGALLASIFWRRP